MKPNKIDPDLPLTDLSLIASMTPKERVIGNKGSLPWDILTDIARFQKYTVEAGTVVVGRKTWEALFANLRSLTGRTIIVMTRQAKYKAEGAIVVHSLEEALFEIKKQGRKACVIGGAETYNQFFPLVQTLFLTIVYSAEQIHGDAYFPEIDMDSWRVTFPPPNRKLLPRKWLPQDEYPTSFEILKRIAP